MVESPANGIFIVHGRDVAAKEKVARFLERAVIAHEVIVLHEQPNRGMSVIEKLEYYSNVAYAVILLTADDEGRLKGSDQLFPRSRQNVIMELGWFVSRLGRQRTCALYEEGVELPSDYDGVLYTRLDSAGAWKAELLRELAAAQIEVDWQAIA